MLGCTFLVCLQKLWYCVPVPWKSKESNNEYLGKISRGNKDIYQTFVRIKTFRVRHQDYRELVVLIYDTSLLYTEEMIAESICCRSWIALLTNPLQQRMLYSSISLEQCCRIIFGQTTQLKEKSIAVTDWVQDVDEHENGNPLWKTLPKVSKTCTELKNCKYKYLC